MSAVTLSGAISRLMLESARVRPYQALRRSTWMDTVHSREGRSPAPISVTPLRSAPARLEAARRPAHRQRGEDDEQHQHERARVGLILFRLERAQGEVEDAQWDGIYGPQQAGVEEGRAEGGHQQRRCL